MKLTEKSVSEPAEVVGTGIEAIFGCAFGLFGAHLFKSPLLNFPGPFSCDAKP
jgi:hypothetical protein